MKRHFYLLSYDIQDPKRRRQVALRLQNYRFDGQRSVAECWLGESEFARLWAELCLQIDTQQDSLIALAHHKPDHDLRLGKANSTNLALFIVS